MSRTLGMTVEAGGLLVACLLPLWFAPFAHAPFESPKARLFAVIACVVLGAFAARGTTEFVARRRHASQFSPKADNGYRTTGLLVGFVLLFVVVRTVATVHSEDVATSFLGTRDNPNGTVLLWASVLFALSLGSVLRTPTQVRRLAKALIVGSVPVVLYGFAQAMRLDPLPWVTDSVSPVHSTLGRSNFLGGYLAMIIPFTLWLIVDSEQQSWRNWAILLGQVTCLWLTLGRGAWLAGMAAALVFLVLMAVQRRDRRVALFVTVVLIGCAIGYQAMSRVDWSTPTSEQAVQAQTNQTIVARIRQDSIERRWIIWEHTLRLIPSHWLLGYGPNTFQQVFSVAYPPGSLFQGTDSTITHPHNLFLDQLVSAGVVGLAAMLGIGVVLLVLLLPVAVRCQSSTAAALLAAMTAFFVQAQFNPTVVVLDVLFWLLIAMTFPVAIRFPVAAVKDHARTRT